LSEKKEGAGKEADKHASDKPALDTSVSIPSAVFRDRTLKPLEAMVEYLREHHNLTIHQIAKLLNRDDRTIWTVYHRAKVKRA
jgi:hypothetical protein